MHFESLANKLRTPVGRIAVLVVPLGSAAAILAGCGEVGTPEQRAEVDCVPAAIQDQVSQGLTWDQARDAAVTICDSQFQN